MKIQILSIEVNNATSKGGKPYEQLVVAYKDLDFGGKVASKTIMPFGFQKETFTILKGAKPAEVFDVEVQKNEAGYNDWIKATKGSAQTVAASAPATSATSTPSKAGGWETPEERKAKQTFIVRQSSLTNAIATLTVGRKGEIKPEEVIELAQRYESFVFSEDRAREIIQQDVGRIEDITEDPLPF